MLPPEMARPIVADEPATRRAWIPRARARVLREPAEMLSGLLRIPGVVRDPHVLADGLRTRRRAEVLERLERRVNAEVRPSHIGGEHTRIARAGQSAIVERNRHGAARSGPRSRAGTDRSLSSSERRSPRSATTMSARRRRLRQLYVRQAGDGIPVLVRQVQMAGIGRARREALGDAAAEPSVGVGVRRACSPA